MLNLKGKVFRFFCVSPKQIIINMRHCYMQDKNKKITNPQDFPNDGCCKYPIGNKLKFRWCNKSAAINGYCFEHYQKCYVVKNQNTNKKLSKRIIQYLSVLK